MLSFTIKPKPHLSAKYYINCTGRPGIWLTRLRLGLSALKDHRFKYNLIDDPYCEFCGHKENTKHFLFDCEAYTPARTNMYNKLAHSDIDITNKTNLLHTILHGTLETIKNKVLQDIIFEYLKETNRFT